MGHRQFELKRRGAVSRRRKPIILIAAEGKNKTEKNYFESFNGQDKKYKVIVKSHGDTDPHGMLKNLKGEYKRAELNKENGDLAFVVLDLDCKQSRAIDVRSLSSDRTNKKFPFICSNPCVELWFRLHFEPFSTHEYTNQSEVIDDLQKFIPNYKKSKNVYSELLDKTEFAIINAERLEQFHGTKLWPSIECNPRTDVNKIVRRILEPK